MVNWSAHTKHTLPLNCNNTKAGKAPIDEGKIAQARINDG